MPPSLLLVLLPLAGLFGADDAARVIAKVNGTAITAGDVGFIVATRNVKSDERAEKEPQLIEELIDRQVVREFLVRRKISPPADELAYQIQVAEEVIKKHGDDPAQLLPKLGYTSERLKSELGLPLAWQAYARQTITLPQTREYFEQHRVELDGTQVRVRQIFLKLAPKPEETEIAAKVKTLKDLKGQIASGKITFQDAAKKHSESPTRDQGGEVGLIGFRGKLPAPVCRAAFSLKVNEISEPVISPFGVHLVQVTEIVPGDLSLEDVRPQIFDRLSEQLWTDTIARERKSAKIERR